MSDKRRPPSIRPGLAPREPIPTPGMRQVVFHFDTAVPATSVTIDEAQLAKIQEVAEAAWRVSAGASFTVNDDAGQPLLVINMGKVRAVEFR